MVKIVCFSDTHGYHKRVKIPSGDIVVFAGDFSAYGTKEDSINFIDWFGKLPFQHKIFTFGNHDLFFERGNSSEIQEVLNSLSNNVYCLNDNGIELDGIKFWASAVTPVFRNWAFNRTPEQIQKHWNLIPLDTQVLITHGPPYGTLDKVPRDMFGAGPEHAGCLRLKNKIKQINPLIHCFGHIHAMYGSVKKGKTLYINASICDEAYNPKNSPWVVELNGADVKIVSDEQAPGSNNT